LPLDISADPWVYVDPARLRNFGTALRVVDERAVLLNASNLLEDAAFDRYEFIRDGFLQRRQSQVFDGQSNRKEAQEEAKQEAQSNARALTADTQVAATSGDKAASSETQAK
jgi:phospholipid-binding lipoprotein MlaA